MVLRFTLTKHSPQKGSEYHQNQKDGLGDTDVLFLPANLLVDSKQNGHLGHVSAEFRKETREKEGAICFGGPGFAREFFRIVVCFQRRRH